MAALVSNRSLICIHVIVHRHILVIIVKLSIRLARVILAEIMALVLKRISEELLSKQNLTYFFFLIINYIFLEIFQNNFKRCSCASGYTGINCEIVAEACLTNSCNGNGICYTAGVRFYFIS